MVRTPEVFRTREDVRRFFATAEAERVSAVALAVKEDEELPTIPSGRAFYASSIAPVASGYESFDVLAAAVEEGHARGIEILAWVPQFHDATAIERDPSWEMATLDETGAVVPYVGAGGERFVSPAHPDARAYERSIVREVAERYAVDGIVLDWIRYDGWATGLEEASRAGYRERWGVDPVDIDFATDGADRRRWGEHRAEIVASHVREVRADLGADVRLAVFVLPPAWTELSQDTGLFADSVDAIYPMAYFDDWGFSPSWVYDEVVPQLRARAGEGPAIVPTLDEDWTDAQNEEVLVGLRDRAPFVRSVAWFAYGDWSDDLIARLAPLRICAP